LPKHLKRRWLHREVYEYFAVNVAPWLGWRDPILVYQMGKVASSSIRNSLFRCPDPKTQLVLMSHEFYPLRNRDTKKIKIEPQYREHVLREIQFDREVWQRFPWRKRWRWRLRERFYSEQIYRSYVRTGHRLRVISPIREPIGNNVSMFFEVFDHYAGTSIEETQLSVDEMIALFLEKYMHWRPLVWFDAELKTTLGVDVYQHAFDAERGYGSFREGRVEMLILKFDLPDETKSRVIAEFLGLDELPIVSSNISSERSQADAYAEFRRKLRIPEALLDEMYESKYARHFFTEAQRADYRKRWGGCIS
jgi:hypothetical protein